MNMASLMENPMNTQRTEGPSLTKVLPVVYLLYCCGRVKIGKSRDHLRRILNEILPCCPVPMRILRTIPGDRELEASLHKRFDDALIRDEWFALTPELRAFIVENDSESLDEAEDDYEEWLEQELDEQRSIKPAVVAD